MKREMELGGREFPLPGIEMAHGQMRMGKVLPYLNLRWVSYTLTITIIPLNKIYSPHKKIIANKYKFREKYSDS